MEWYTWLSKTNLDKSLIYDYSLVFSRNELEEEDISHFNHEFLQSMGISIAKHRLEILKLSKSHKTIRPSMTRLLTAPFHLTKRCLVRCIKALVHREYSSAIVVVQTPPPKKAEMLKRNKRSSVAKHKVAHQERPPRMIMAGPGPRQSSASPLIFEDGFRSGLGSVESIRWDSMFQGLKPT